MEFKENRPIYIQIADHLCDRILAGTLTGEGRIPSVRETAVEFQVNPNTVVRSYSHLQEMGIIRNQRGIGYFLTDKAFEETLTLRREEFMRKDLPLLFRTMELLKIDREMLNRYYDEHRSKKQ